MIPMTYSYLSRMLQNKRRERNQFPICSFILPQPEGMVRMVWLLRLRASDLDWGLHPCTPFSPGAVVHADAGIAQEIPQDQRCLARPVADGAVGDDAALGDHSAVLEEQP